MTDDLDALFEEVAAQRSEKTTPPVPAPAVAAAPPQAQATNSTVTETPEENPSDKPMYERLGGIVRLLHDSLRELGYDRALSDAATQITDAQDRLEHIAKLTEQAANKVLNTIDEGMPAQDTLSKKAKDMENRWSELFDGKVSIEDFKTLAAESKQFASTVYEATETEKARLLDIMMAQDFQDITGQLIKKIVGITQKVENELAQLLLDNAPPELKKEKPIELMQGPSAAAMQQDDVDSLLEGLGF